jgi:predicted DNA-binding transcriptional regulator AlpA
MHDRLRFLTKQQVRDKTTLSPAEIDRRERRLEFPKRRRLSGYPRGRVVWWEHEVDEWMVSQTGEDPRGDTSTGA